MGLDKHGQPALRALHATRNQGKSLDELLGICKGAVADGVVNQAEAEFIASWLKVNDDFADQYPANIIRIRLAEYLEDGILDADEREELLGLLKDATGNAVNVAPINMSSRLCFDDPLPEFDFDGTAFCITGKFAFGTRKDIEREIISLGGQLVGAPKAQRGTMLVVGTLSSRDWKHGNFGTKIEKAMEYRDKGYAVSIIPEDWWAERLVAELSQWA